MAGFDPALRREVLYFQNTNIVNSHGDRCLKQLPFVLAEYDGSPDMYLEPLCHIGKFRASLPDNTNAWIPVVPETMGYLVSKIELCDAIPFSDVAEFHTI